MGKLSRYKEVTEESVNLEMSDFAKGVLCMALLGFTVISVALTSEFMGVTAGILVLLVLATALCYAIKKAFKL